jgi:hypothetical protein
MAGILRLQDAKTEGMRCVGIHKCRGRQGVRWEWHIFNGPV